MSACGDLRAVLTINLGALARNWRRLRDRVAPAECAAVVKANAYGIGIAAAVPALAKAGCRTFFVAQSSEGVAVREALRACAENGRIFILNGLGSHKPPPEYATSDLAPVLGSFAEVEAWAAHLAQYPRAAAPALHFNTGMNRLGITQVENAGWLDQAMALQPALVMSHLIAAEERNNPLNTTQSEAFSEIAGRFPKVQRSLANSSGIFLTSKPFHDLVRPGYALYGGNPMPGKPNPMEAVVHLEAPIVQAHWAQKGETVGYNAQWTAQRRTKLAVLGVGYADGFPLHAGHGAGKPGMGQAVVLGQKCPVVGRISMDLMVLDITEVPDAAPGIMAGLICPQISIDELAGAADTIGYAVLTGLGQRYRRKYIDPAPE